MTTIVTRAGKGTPLTNTEVDTNFTNLNTAKIETLTSTDTSVTITGTGSSRDLSVPVNPNVVSGPASATDNAIARFDTTTGKLIQNSVVTIDDAGNLIGLDSAQFSGTPPTTTPSGALWFDSTNNSLNFQQNAITQQIGEEMFVYGKASAAITEGQLICKTGVVGASGQITFGPSPANLLDNDGIIGVATENIASGSFGRITFFGVVHGIDATGTSAGQTWLDGDTLWYNPAGGGLMTNVKPVAPTVKYQIATVIHNGGGGSGSIQVNLEAGTTLGGTDNNVQLGTLAAANLLTYSTTSGYWKNTALAAGTGITVGNAASGVVTVTNSAPDQTVSLANGTGISVTGTYPNFTVTNTAPSSGGTVTSVAALTLGTTGTDLSSTVATGTTTPVITLNVPTASAANRGALSAADWTTFNNKTSNTGTVTSVATANGTGISVTGGPITTSGTLTITNTAPDQTVALANGTGISVTGTYPNFTITNSAPGGSITDDTTTAATRYPLFAAATSGSAATIYTSSTKYTYNPSTGALSATSHVSSSDEKLKTNWRSVSPDFIINLASVKSGIFDRLDFKSTEPGVSAQSLQTVIPEAVVTGEDGYLSVNYGGAALVAAIELAKEVQELRAEIAILKAKVGE